MEKIGGVIGGLGTVSTLQFFDFVVKKTKSNGDQDYPNLLIFNHSAIPDRTDYILDNSKENPLPYLISDAKKLEQIGADFLVLPCNTAHYFYDDIASSVDIELLNIVDLTIKEAIKLGFKNLGLLSTKGTIKAKTYENKAKELGVEIVIPDEEYQDLLMEIIYDDLKLEKPVDTQKVDRLIEHMESKGADCFLLACTELSDLKKVYKGKKWIDSLEILARETIVKCEKVLK